MHLFKLTSLNLGFVVIIGPLYSWRCPCHGMPLGNKDGRFIMMHLKNSEHNGYHDLYERLMDH
jgi:uncharacterized Tic20 family protein